jgi:hypothetical protein
MDKILMALGKRIVGLSHGLGQSFNIQIFEKKQMICVEN